MKKKPMSIGKTIINIHWLTEIATNKLAAVMSKHYRENTTR